MGVNNEKRRGSRSLRLPSPAMCVALLALFVGMTSGAYATAKFKHGPKGIVNAQDIAFETITGREIKNRSLFPADMSSSALRNFKGARGATGPQGPTGPQGAAGINGQNGAPGPTRLDYNTFTGSAPPGTQTGFIVPCDSGMYIVGGGAFTDIAYNGGNGAEINSSYPSANSGGVPPPGNAAWTAYIDNFSTVAVAVTIRAVCAPATQVTEKRSENNGLPKRILPSR
jgi:hypothetical protein